MKKRAMWMLSGGCFLLGAIAFAVPGIRFSALFFSGLGSGVLFWVLLDRLSGKYLICNLCKRIFLVTVSALFLLILSLEVLIVSYGEKDRSLLTADAVIVLGAGVNGETPSAVLRSRIEAAAEYIYNHCPEGIPVVLSGGQGNGEDISEAEAMYRALVSHSQREAGENVCFLLEDRSTSTAENFAYSGEILVNYGIDTEHAQIAVVTNDFHCYRSRLIAQREGLSTFGISAELPWWWLSANYYLRESFALVKTLLFD